MERPAASVILRASSPTAPTIFISAAPQRQHAEFAGDSRNILANVYGQTGRPLSAA
jgi:hypothetical protein